MYCNQRGHSGPISSRNMVARSDKAVKRARGRQYMKALRCGVIRNPSPKTLYQHAIVHVLGSADGRAPSEYVFCEDLLGGVGIQLMEWEGLLKFAQAMRTGAPVEGLLRWAS